MKTSLALITRAWVAMAVALVLAPPVLAQTEPSGTWLEGESNWNQPRSAIPAAPAIPGGGNLPNCLENRRPAALPEDEQVQAAGWTLFGAAQIFGETTVITAMADADGMCRPRQYQVFVFTQGQFSGTLSPTPMDSRTDGSLVDANLYRSGYLSASFNRYTPEDALCCPSASSLVFYQVENLQGSPVLVPQLPASTNPTSAGQ